MHTRTYVPAASMCYAIPDPPPPPPLLPSFPLPLSECSYSEARVCKNPHSDGSDDDAPSAASAAPGLGRSHQQAAAAGGAAAAAAGGAAAAAAGGAAAGARVVHGQTREAARKEQNKVRLPPCPSRAPHPRQAFYANHNRKRGALRKESMRCPPHCAKAPLTWLLSLCLSGSKILSRSRRLPTSDM